MRCEPVSQKSFTVSRDATLAFWREAHRKLILSPAPRGHNVAAGTQASSFPRTDEWTTANLFSGRIVAWNKIFRAQSYISRAWTTPCVLF